MKLRPMVAILPAVAGVFFLVAPGAIGAQRKPAPISVSTPKQFTITRPPATGAPLRILLVDDDWSDNNNNPSDSRRSPSDLAFRRLVLDAAGGDASAVAIDVVRLYANGPDIDRLRTFSLIVWYTGASYGGNADNASVLSITDEKTVRRYLEETGGTVILASPGYVSKVLGANSTWDKATWLFLNEVLGIKGGKGLAQRFQGGTVVTPGGTKFTVGRGTGAVETQFSAVNPDGASVVFTAALAARDIGDQPAPVATVSSFGRGRIVYVGFTFENLDAAELAPAFRVLLAASAMTSTPVAAAEPTIPIKREPSTRPRPTPIERNTPTTVVQPPPAVFTPGGRTGEVPTTKQSVLPSVSGFLNPSKPAGMQGSAYAGDTLVVQGVALSNVTRVALREALRNPDGTYRANTSAPPRPVTPLTRSWTEIRFVANAGPLSASLGTAFIVEVSSVTGTVASLAGVSLFERPVDRHIAAVDRRFVRSGQRLTVTGANFDPQGLPGQVSGGFIGNGTPGSVSNPLLDMWSLSNSSVTLVAPPGCNSRGLLMLALQQRAGVEAYIYPKNDPIEITCVADTPAGVVTGAENGNRVSVPAGAKIVIRGRGFRAVTGVRTQNTNMPLTWRMIPTTPPVEERIEVTLPTGTGQTSFAFSLDNALTDPVVNGSVTGAVSFLMPPRLDGIWPLWGEPGRWLRLTGSELMPNGQRPSVTVGGVPATVLSASNLELYFVAPENTPNAAVVFSNAAGSFAVPSVPTQLPPDVRGYTGFYMLTGPSVVDSIVGPRQAFQPMRAYGANLARLRGLCWTQDGQAPRVLLRTDQGANPSNTAMEFLWFDPAGPVQLEAPTTPPGQYAPSSFACRPNPKPVTF